MSEWPRGRGRTGFTLIEMMIAVAILGILAAIAIPNFLRFHLRSRSAEGKANLAAVRTAEESYFSEFGLYVSGSPSPPGWAPGASARNPRPWVDAGAPDSFTLVGWAPEGTVYYQYQVRIGTESFTSEARSDIDGDGHVNVWGYLKPSIGGSTTPGSFGCPATGVYDPNTASNTVLEMVGPCAADMGQSIF